MSPATPRPNEPPRYAVGLDLGQASDYTALSVVERTPSAGAAEAGGRPLDHAVRHLYRWPLGTSYVQVVRDVAGLTARPPLPGSALLLDATGVGRPVADMFRSAGLPVRVVPVTITSGRDVSEREGGGFCVPKLDLVGVMTRLVQARRFHISPALPDAAALGKELQMFRVKVNAATGNETFESWRERDKDDIILSVALACWWGERRVPNYGDPVCGGPKPDYTRLYGPPPPGDPGGW